MASRERCNDCPACLMTCATSPRPTKLCVRCKTNNYICYYQTDEQVTRQRPACHAWSKACAPAPKRKAPAVRSSQPNKKAANNGSKATATAKSLALVKYGGRALADCVAPVLRLPIAGASASWGDHQAWLDVGKPAIPQLAQLEGFYFAAQKLTCLQEYDTSRLPPHAELLRLREGMAAQQTAFDAGTLDITKVAECCTCFGTCAAMSDDAVARGALRAGYGESFLFTGLFVLVDRETVEANVREWVDLLLEHPKLGAWPRKVAAPSHRHNHWERREGNAAFARDFNNVQSGDARLWSDFFLQSAWPGKASPRIDAPPRDRSEQRHDTIICEIMKGPANETGRFMLKTVVFVPKIGRYVTVSFPASRPAIVSTLSATLDQRAALRERFRAFALARTDPKELNRLAPTVIKSKAAGNTGIIVLKTTQPGTAARVKALKKVADSFWQNMFKPNAKVQTLLANLSRGVREDFAARGINLDDVAQYVPAEARESGLVREGHEVEDVIDLVYKRAPLVDPDATPLPPLPTVDPSVHFTNFRVPDPRIGARIATYWEDVGAGEWCEGRITREQTTDEGVLELRVEYDDGVKMWEQLADEPFDGDGAPPAVDDDDDGPVQFRFVGAAPTGPVETPVFESFGNAIRARLLALPRTCLTWPPPPPPAPGGGGGFRNQGNDPNQNPTFPPGTVAGPYVKMSWHGSSREIRNNY